MKKSFSKKALVLMTVLALSLVALVGCGGDTTEPQADGQTPAVAMTDDEYKAKVKEVYDSINEKAATYSQQMNGADQEAIIKTTQDMIAELTPLYTELGGLQAPDTYKDAQTKIKAGADASVRLLEMSKEMLEMAANPDQADAAAAQQKLTEEMDGLEATVTDFNAALQEVLQ